MTSIFIFIHAFSALLETIRFPFNGLYECTVLVLILILIHVVSHRKPTILWSQCTDQTCWNDHLQLHSADDNGVTWLGLVLTALHISTKLPYVGLG